MKWGATSCCRTELFPGSPWFHPNST